MLQEGHLVGGRYRIVGRAGAGGSGVVYRAIDQVEGGPVALKVLIDADPGDLKRFEREIAVLRGSTHPRVVRYVDHGRERNVGAYLVLEWLEGETLAQRLARAGLRVTDVVKLGVDLAGALQSIHEKGIVHRDLKPGNIILLGKDVRDPKILDFGIARSTAHTHITMSGSMMGTVGYMAPEQARGDAGIDAGADIFSLGCVLFQCATGRVPFDGESASARLLKLAMEDAPRADAVSSSVPADLADVLEHLLQKDKFARPPSMTAVAVALSEVRTSVGEEAPRSIRIPAITATERRFMSLLVLSRPPGAVAALVRAELGRHGGVPFGTTDGAILLTFSGGSVASDLARSAARTALAIAAIDKSATIAVLSARSAEERVALRDAMGRTEELFKDRPLGGIVVDDVTRGLIEGSFETAPLTVAPGRPGRAFRLIGERSVRKWATRDARATPFVGREREIDTIVQAYRHAVEDRASEVVTVLAAPGIGKSRLVAETLGRLREEDPPPEVLVGVTDEAETAAPFGLLRSALRRLAALPRGSTVTEDDAADALRERLREFVLPHALDDATDFVAELLELPRGPGTESAALRAARADVALMNEQLVRAIEIVLRGILRARPVVLVLEDMQWADSASVALLDRFLAQSAHEPLLVLGTGRLETQERFPGLFAERSLTSVMLRELRPRAAEDLARRVLGAEVEEAIVQRVVELAAGNAFYLEEIARALEEGAGMALPQSVVAMVQARLSRLEDHERMVLRAGSVYGAVFTMAGVDALIGKEPGLAAALKSLTKRDMIEELGGPDEARMFSFRHAMLREAAYASIPEAELARAHLRAAEFLEKNGEVSPAVMAHHFELAKAGERAGSWYLRSGRQALVANVAARARECADKALACAVVEPARGAALLLAAEAENARWNLAEATGAAREAMAHLPRASTLWFMAAQERAKSAQRTGDSAAMLELAREIASVDPVEDATNAAVHALSLLAHGLAQSSLSDDARLLVARIDALVPLLPAGAPALVSALLARGTLALLSGHLGRFRALRVELAERYERASDVRKAIEAWGSVGYVDVLLGRYERAESALKSCIARADALGLLVAHVFRQNLGLCLLQMRRYGDARAELERTLPHLTAKNKSRYEVSSRHYLARVLCELGELQAAEDQAKRAIGAAADLVPSRIEGGTALAHVLLAQGRVREARDEMERAFSLFETVKEIDEGEVFVRVTLVRARIADGDTSLAKAALIEAHKRVCDMASRIEEDELRDGFVSNVPENWYCINLARTMFGSIPPPPPAPPPA